MECAFAISIIFLSVAVAYNWTSRSPANGTVYHTCLGDPVTFAWSFTLTSAESVNDVEWYFTETGGNVTLVASFIQGELLLSHSATQHLTFVANAGLRISNIRHQDLGQYSVRLVINSNLSFVVDTGFVYLRAPEPPTISDGLLHVRMLPSAIRQESGDWHVQLACGNVTSRGSLNFSVNWTTPSGQILGSSFARNGEEILNVDPVEEGNYSCFLDIRDSTARCVNISPAMLVSNEMPVDTCSLKQPLRNLVQQEKQEMESVFKFLTRQHDTIRLVDGNRPWNGRVEVKYNGSWSVVCDDLFSVWSATVVCTMLGITRGSPEVRSDSFYGEGELPILLDDVICRGNETTIFDCSHRPLGIHNCHRSEIVGVDCLSELTSS